MPGQESVCVCGKKVRGAPDQGDIELARRGVVVRGFAMCAWCFAEGAWSVAMNRGTFDVRDMELLVGLREGFSAWLDCPEYVPTAREGHVNHWAIIRAGVSYQLGDIRAIIDQTEEERSLNHRPGAGPLAGSGTPQINGVGKHGRYEGRDHEEAEDRGATAARTDRR